MKKEKCDALGLPNERKRTMVANTTAGIVHCRAMKETKGEEEEKEMHERYCLKEKGALKQVEIITRLRLYIEEA